MVTRRLHRCRPRCQPCYLTCQYTGYQRHKCLSSQSTKSLLQLCARRALLMVTLYIWSPWKQSKHPWIEEGSPVNCGDVARGKLRYSGIKWAPKGGPRDIPVTRSSRQSAYSIRCDRKCIGVASVNVVATSAEPVSFSNSKRIYCQMHECPSTSSRGQSVSILEGSRKGGKVTWSYGVQIC